ncbi:hypothetical protein NE857_13465 [Nocardiopsis exhalans]|uniref:Uncharacterized protein n=1 Tax=Nocardiopsis exhalans TaxID=163604 RepID=A0ABY5DGK8_9ACTN|nr:hypothetical protein [Nocardiopsis exhalans]USY22524.1 hypothetical protein NE857_13465 [Nocardiopsis exhalans]
MTVCAAVSAVLALTACAPVEDFLSDAAWSGVPQNPVPVVDQVDRDDPFGGTRAEDYAEGFEAPEAASIGGHPADRVQEAYETTRDFLEAVYLEPDAVFDEDNSAFTALLTGQALDWYLEYHGHEDPELDSRGVPFNLAPGTAEPIGDVVKVDGRMWAETARDENGWDYLAVHTEYTIVHPVSRPDGSASVRLVTSHYGEVAFYDPGDGTWEAFPNWWRFVGPAHCLAEEHTFTPAYPDEGQRGERARGVPEDAYDLDNARDQEDCGAIRDT